MDVKQCYEKMGGDYDDVMSRLRTEIGRASCRERVSTRV